MIYVDDTSCYNGLVPLSVKHSRGNDKYPFIITTPRTQQGKTNQPKPPSKSS